MPRALRATPPRSTARPPITTQRWTSTCAPQGIRVNTLCPRFIRTPLAEQTLAIPERRAWVLSRIKLGRLGEIEDIMGPVVFLASDASAIPPGLEHILFPSMTGEASLYRVMNTADPAGAAGRLL